jgi:hypothetical protein
MDDDCVMIASRVSVIWRGRLRGLIAAGNVSVTSNAFCCDGNNNRQASSLVLSPRALSYSNKQQYNTAVRYYLYKQQ